MAITRNTSTNQTQSPTIPCPVPNCPFELPINKPTIIQTHLTTAHSCTEISTVPPSFYTNANIFKCPICPPQRIKLYKSNKTLNNHIKSVHKTSTRTQSNTELLTSKFPIDPSHHQTVSKQWTDTLQYLHRLDIIPFSFRRSLYHKTPIKIRHQLQSILYKVIEVLLTSTNTHTDANSPHVPQHQSISTPIWKLFLLFEGTMLAPASPIEPRKHDILIKYRIDMFFNGKFNLLHKSAMQELSPPNTDTPTIEQRSKQIEDAANNDDWKKASKLLQEPLPSVPYSEEFLPTIQNLHPPPTSYTPTIPLPRPNPSLHSQSFSTSNDTIRARLRDETLLLSTLRRLKRNKSSGPYADSTDLLKDVFLVRSKTLIQSEERYPHITILGDLLHLLYSGNLPKEVRQYINANESVSFHKDTTNLQAIRPIGIGTAIRRIAATHAMAATKDSASEILAPNQYAIGLSSGMDIITQTMQTHTSRFLNNHSNHSPIPSRAILILDLQNMFNSVSMKKAREIIHKKFPHLLPLFDILYYDDTRCWYRRPDGHRDYILRKEGSSQGCPFAAFLACLVLDDIIKTLDTELGERARARKANNCVSDDGIGTRAIVMSYIDDTTVSIGYEDLTFFLDRFKELGAPLGCILKLKKCKIMTSTNGFSPINRLHQQHKQDLIYALNTYCGGQAEGEITTGTRILGAPIGNPQYVQHYQNTKIQKLRQAIDSIHTLVPDPHISITLFKYSLQHYVTHLLPTDILHNNNTSSEYKHYSTQFTKTINETTKHFINTIISSNDETKTTLLPHHSRQISTTPSGLGGLGFHDIEARAIRTFTTPLANSIRTTKYGLIPQKINVKETLLQDINIKLPQHITSTFKG